MVDLGAITALSLTGSIEQRCDYEISNGELTYRVLPKPAGSGAISVCPEELHICSYHASVGALRSHHGESDGVRSKPPRAHGQYH